MSSAQRDTAFQYNIQLTDQRTLFSYSDPEGMLEEIIKRQTFIFLKLLPLFKELHVPKRSKKMPLNQRANPADQEQNHRK